MCSILGAILNCDVVDTIEGKDQVNDYLEQIWALGRKRGRDGQGYSTLVGTAHYLKKSLALSDPIKPPQCEPHSLAGTVNLIGNYRAEPTTEFIKNKQLHDQQPYQLGPWAIVHNGIIHNDRLLRTYKYPSGVDSAAIVELLNEETSGDLEVDFKRTISQIEGSYAILAQHCHKPQHLFVACNYRPIWYIKTIIGFFFASSKSQLPDSDDAPAQMMEPYSMAIFTPYQKRTLSNIPPMKQNTRTLVVCSGGLDSVVTATLCKNLGQEVTLLHFAYGSRCQDKEIEAVKNIGKFLNVPVVIKALPVYSSSDSNLLQEQSEIAGGEEGAEFAHEWVPARNLVFLSIAAAYAEANNFSVLALGNNMEEAGAYPDNEPEFIDKFNELLPFATGPNKHLRVEMPLGNYVKHEIVAIGLVEQAPLHLTWSCYKSGELHCGTCGPCYMRKKAFEINQQPECIKYLTNEESK